MRDDPKAEGIRFGERLRNLTPQEIADGNAIESKRAKEEYERFASLFAVGVCYLCNKPLSSFSKKRPCTHWLLKPKGFKKKDLPAVAEVYGYFQIQSFLRWVANQAAFARNINNIEVEGSGKKLFELTIKWRNLEWAFSCAESDYHGHATSQHSKHAHYHVQMRIDGRPFVNYSDFHLPFSHMDIIEIEAARANPTLVKRRFSFGEGMGELLTDANLLNVIDSTIPTTDEQGVFHIQTFATAEEGKLIQSDDVLDIIQEAKDKGVTLASLIHKLPNATSAVVVTAGPGVVEQAVRGGRGGDA